MDNVVAGVVGVALFLAFTFGLAESIGAVPFFLIVIGVAILACVDLWQSIRDNRRERNSAADDTGT